MNREWIKTTSCNLIFHHVPENLEDTKERTDRDDKEHLEDYVFLFKLGLRGTKVAKTERIGNFTKEKDEKDEYRPMEVTFQNEEDKKRFLKPSVSEDV